MIKRRSSNRLTAKELYTFKLHVFLMFVACAFILQIWFAFRGHHSLDQNSNWLEVISSKTHFIQVQRKFKSLSSTNRTENKEFKTSKQHKRIRGDLFSLERDKQHSASRTKTRLESKQTKSFKNRKEYLYSAFGKLKKSPNIRNKVKTEHNYYKETRYNQHKSGELLSMKWTRLCCESVNCLRKHPLFPSLPSYTNFVTKLLVSNTDKLYAQRITGRLAPSKSGHHTFLVKCQGSCEIWLSEDRFPQSSKLFAKVVHNLPVNFTNNSQDFTIKLSVHRTYFIDIILTVYRSVERALEISWKLPGSKTFVTITEDFLAPISDPREVLIKVFSQTPSVRLTPFLESIEEAGEDDDEFEILGKRYRQEDIQTHDLDGDIVTVNRNAPLAHNGLSSTKFDIASPLKQCVQKSAPNSSVRNITKYEGVWKTHFLSVFPEDNTGYMMCIGNRYPLDCKGNERISQGTVKKLLKLYNRALNGRTNKKEEKLKITSVVNVEEKKDLQGSRFFLEVILVNTSSNAKFYHSRYLSMNKQGTSLCVPQGLTFEIVRTINVVIVVKNQPRWLRHFLANMEKMYTRTKDKKLNIIIAYYGKEDAKLMKEFKSNRLPHIRTVRHFGKFHKTKAIQSAVNTINDPNSIVFLMDLHIVLPNTMMSLVRKHTIQSKMVFNPVLFRLSRCASPGSYTKPPRGFWETFGYGVLGIYKSDWDRIGGMSTAKYKGGWGGEDWEILDRILTAGLDVQRLRVPNFYHFYHSKKNMWN